MKIDFAWQTLNTATAFGLDPFESEDELLVCIRMCIII